MPTYTDKHDARVVDHQTHWLPATYLDLLAQRKSSPRVEYTSEGYLLETPGQMTWRLSPEHTNLDVHFADMDAHDIDVMVSSPAIIGELDGLSGSRLRDAADHLNDATSCAQRTYPERFVGLAVLPMADPTMAVEAVDRAIGELGLSGVCIFSNIGGRTPISIPDLLPVYRRIESWGVPIFLHPASRSLAYERRLSPVVERGMAWMCDTSIAAASLIVDGILDSCPDLTIVHPHLGGVLPYISGRLAASSEVIGDAMGPIEGYLRDRFYTDSAGDTHAAFAMAAEAYGADRVLYATDYPFRSRAAMKQKLESLDGQHLSWADITGNHVPGI